MTNYNELRDGQEFYGNGYKKGYEDAKKEFERAKGKWIECTKSGMPLTEYGRMTGEKWYGFKCSQCNFIYKGNALIDSPFCQKCGADMRMQKDGEDCMDEDAKQASIPYTYEVKKND